MLYMVIVPTATSRLELWQRRCTRSAARRGLRLRGRRVDGVLAVLNLTDAGCRRPTHHNNPESSSQ